MAEAITTGQILVYVTVPDMAVGQKLARALVEARLAAGVNILPGVRSIYRWQGEVHDDPELFCVIQSRQDRFEELERAVLALHPYDVPKIISVDIRQGHGPYLAWIDRHTRGPSELDPADEATEPLQEDIP